MFFVLFLFFAAAAHGEFETDIIKTAQGDLEISHIGHGSLMFRFQKKVIHIDPFSRLADYSKLPKADLILITHEHRDHLDPVALEAIRKDNTLIVVTPTCKESYPGDIIMGNGDIKTVQGFPLEAVPTYNIVHMRGNGAPFHPKDIGNGYILTIGDKRIYVAGDTENTPEMKQLKRIDVAFLPMNLPYTMTPEMVADAAKAFKPKVLYPYHTGETDITQLVNLMKDSTEIEVRIRQMK